MAKNKTTKKTTKSAVVKNTEKLVKSVKDTTALLREKAATYVVTGKGKDRRIDNGDEVAAQLREIDLDALYTLVAKEGGPKESELRAKYEKLNKGMQRMNLGNRLRKLRSEEVAATPKPKKTTKAPKVDKEKMKAVYEKATGNAANV